MPRPEVRIVLAYLVMASIWVICSDRLLQSVMPARPGSLQTLKGLNFVATTSLLLFFVLRRAYHGWRRAEREQWAMMSEMSEMFRNLSIRVEGLREADRTRISRELHDQLGQELTGLKMELRWIESRLEIRDDRSLNPLTDRLVETQEQVDSLITTVQRIAADLRPDILDDLGLAQALVQEAERFGLRSAVACHVEVAGLPDEIPPEMATAAFRIFQEALTNVARHAAATEVHASCRVVADALELIVADNGKGMPAGVIPNAESLGLLGMRERAELLGGKVTFTPGEGGGTRVTATLPWRARS
jgi:two-component system sensor histidine kinase UhpB